MVGTTEKDRESLFLRARELMGSLSTGGRGMLKW